MADIHFLLGEGKGNTTDAVRIHKKFPQSESVKSPFSLSAERRLERREHFAEFDGVLAVHFLYEMYGWIMRSRSRLKSLPSVPGVSLPGFCIPYIARTAVVTLSHIHTVGELAPEYTSARRAFSQQQSA